jgi:hypothetical protein
MESSKEIIHQDLLSLVTDWEEVFDDHSLVESAPFLKKMHEHILVFESHLNSFQGDAKIKDLISHILHTPSGAPISTNKSLLQSATSFDEEDLKTSTFYKFMKRSIDVTDKSTNYVFNSFRLLEEMTKSSS